MFENIILNLSPKGAQVQMLEGREHLVVPCVMLTNGVHAGSKGPLYYSAEEIENSVTNWDHKPVVIYHPMRKGQAISAADPVVIETRRVGIILNTRYIAGKLHADLWLDKEKLKKVDERVLLALEQDQQVEVSTGLKVANERKEGEWEGKRYVGIAKNFRPDHLAILPDIKGACSIADGCGILQNASYQDAMRLIQSALEARFGEYCWACSTYDTHIIFEKEGKYLYIEYELENGNVKLSEDAPKAVYKEVIYKFEGTGESVSNAADDQSPCACQDSERKETVIMASKELVDAVINCKHNTWEEADRVTLNGMTDAQIKKINTEEPKAEQAGSLKDPNDTLTQEQRDAVANAAKKGAEGVQAKVEKTPDQMLADYISNAPGPLQDVLQDALTTNQVERVKLVDEIVANKANTFTKEQLLEKKTPELRAIAAFARSAAPVPAPGKYPSFAGAAVPVHNAQQHANNQQQANAQHLPLPVMTFPAK
jgi:hypothetical protein